MKLSKILIVLSIFISCKSNQEISNKNTKKNKDILLSATDFKQKESAIPFYIDKQRQALAINAVIHKNKFSSAISVFNGNKGLYNINLITLKEIDGESSYRVIINGKLIKEVQNPETEKDFEEQTFSIKNIKIKKGILKYLNRIYVFFKVKLFLSENERSRKM